MRLDDLMTSESELVAEANAQDNPPAPTPAPRPEQQEKPRVPQKQQGSKGEYQNVIDAAQKLLYNKASSAQTMKRLQAGAKNPAQALAQVTLMIMLQIYEATKGKMSQDVLTSAIGELLALVAEFAARSGAFEVDQAVLEQAAQYVAAMLKGGREQTANQGQQQPQQQPGVAPPGAAPPQQQGIINGAGGV